MNRLDKAYFNLPPYRTADPQQESERLNKLDKSEITSQNYKDVIYGQEEKNQNSSNLESQLKDLESPNGVKTTKKD